MTEEQERELVVKEARSWIGTPYHSNADVKGHGVDCGMILVRIFVDTGLVSRFDPRPYPPQWAFHQSTERYLGIVQSLAREIPGPPQPGDLVLFKVGKCWAHGGVVLDWPEIIHANPPGPVMIENCQQVFDIRRRTPRFFSIWPREIES